MDRVISETKNLMNEIARLVTASFVCARKVRAYLCGMRGILLYFFANFSTISSSKALPAILNPPVKEVYIIYHRMENYQLFKL